MRSEMSALATYQWSAILRAVAARISADLLAELDRPPPPASRLHRERQLGAGQFCLREVARDDRRCGDAARASALARAESPIHVNIPFGIVRPEGQIAL
jgi:hypothetical protein